MKHLTHDQIDRVNGLVRSLQKNYFAQQTALVQPVLSPLLNKLQQQHIALMSELKELVAQDPMALKVVDYAIRVTLLN